MLTPRGYNMTSYKKYPKYKDSNVAWLGEIPEHWISVKFKQVLEEKKKKTNLSLNCGSISFGTVVYKDNEKIPAETKASYQEVLKGEFLINPLNLNFDLKSLRTALSTLDVVVSTGYIVLKHKSNINPYYLRWLLYQFDVAHMKTLGAGVRQTVNFTNIGNEYFFIPPLQEQQAIANYLDKATAKIDTLIQKQEKLIELLKEKRQALISHAVTKELNPDAKMKDSGIEWLGEIPEHWILCKLKYYGIYKSGDFISADKISKKGIYPVLGGNGLRGYSDTFNLKGHYVIIGRQGALCGNINYSQGKFWATEHAIVVHNKKNINVKWLGALLDTMNLNQYSVSAAQPGLAVENITNLKAILPPLSEQKEIAQYLDDKTSKIDNLITKATKAIDLLKEKRTALISATVTGKIDVREQIL